MAVLMLRHRQTTIAAAFHTCSLGGCARVVLDAAALTAGLAAGLGKVNVCGGGMVAGWWL